MRSTSVKRPRPKDQATDKAPKRARSASTSRRSLSPKRDYPRGTCRATRPSRASPKRAEDRPASAQDLEAFKADVTLMLSDMLQSSFSKFASQFNPSSGGQGDSVPAQTVTSVPTTDVASDHEDIPPGPEDQSEGEIVDFEGDPADTGIPRLDSLKMTEEEERDSITSLLPQSRCLSDLGGLRRIRMFQSLSPRTFFFSPGSPCNSSGHS